MGVLLSKSLQITQLKNGPTTTYEHKTQTNWLKIMAMTY